MIDIAQLHHLYYHEEKSASEIASILGCDRNNVYYHMKKNGMHRRSKAEAQRIRYDNNIDLSEILHLYFEKELGLEAVGARFGVDSSTIRDRIIKAGYRCRKPKGGTPKFTDVEAAEMARLYHEEEMLPAEIADHFNASIPTICSTLKRVPGFRFRSLKETWALRKKKEEDRLSAEGRWVSDLYETRNPKKKEEVGDRASAEENQKEAPTSLERTYTPPKRFGKVFEPIPLLPPAQVTPERILQLRNDDLTVDDIAAVCSLPRVDIYNILIENGSL